MAKAKTAEEGERPAEMVGSGSEGRGGTWARQGDWGWPVEVHECMGESGALGRSHHQLGVSSATPGSVHMSPWMML